MSAAADETVETPAVVETPETPVVETPETPAVAETVETTPAVNWKDRRIAQLTAKLREEQAKAKPATVTTDPAAAAVAETQADFDARVSARAAELTAGNEFNRQCSEAGKAGEAAFPDFQDRVKQLVTLVDRNDPSQVQTYNQFLSAALETGNAPQLIHALGGDLDEASRIMSLSPIKMAVELTKLAAKAPQAAEGGKDELQLSGAPKPITPVGGRAGPHTQIDPTDPSRSDSLSTAEWMRRRNAQVTKSGSA
jgi:hypothetical protein